MRKNVVVDLLYVYYMYHIIFIILSKPKIYLIDKRLYHIYI